MPLIYLNIGVIRHIEALVSWPLVCYGVEVSDPIQVARTNPESQCSIALRAYNASNVRKPLIGPFTF